MTNYRERENALLALGENMVSEAKKGGADIAEAVLQEGSELSTRVRDRVPEFLNEAASRSAGLRVMRNKRVAVVNSNDLSEAGLDRLVRDALELVSLTQEDPWAGPPDVSELSKRESHRDLSLFDTKVLELDAAVAMERARSAEAAALDFDKRITASEGGSFDRVFGTSVVVTGEGFRGASSGTYASMVVRPVADDDAQKKRAGFHWSARRHLDELDEEKAVGVEAAKRTLAKLGARKVPSQELPVVFDPDAGRSIIGLLAGCITGGAVWRRSSYLADRLDTRVASDAVTLVDDPLIPKAPGSRSFDGEGLLSRTNTVVEQGMLRSFLLDSYSARKLGMSSTASASRGSSGGVGPSTSNFILKPGSVSADEIIQTTKHGLYVTEMMGFGFNAITGDFSRGASGFMIENGKLTFPVSEVTISLNLNELLQRIDVVGSNLDLKTSTAAPTFRVSSMALAGGN